MIFHSFFAFIQAWGVRRARAFSRQGQNFRRKMIFKQILRGVWVRFSAVVSRTSHILLSDTSLPDRDTHLSVSIFFSPVLLKIKIDIHLHTYILKAIAASLLFVVVVHVVVVQIFSPRSHFHSASSRVSIKISSDERHRSHFSFLMWKWFPWREEWNFSAWNLRKFHSNPFPISMMITPPRFRPIYHAECGPWLQSED